MCWMHFADPPVPEREQGKRYILKITGGIKRVKKALEAFNREHSLPWHELQANDRIIAFGAGSLERLTTHALEPVRFTRLPGSVVRTKSLRTEAK